MLIFRGIRTLSFQQTQTPQVWLDLRLGNGEMSNCLSSNEISIGQQSLTRLMGSNPSQAHSIEIRPQMTCGLQPARDVWFKLSSIFTGLVTLDMCNTIGSNNNFDTTLHVFSCCDPYSCTFTISCGHISCVRSRIANLTF
jgi:hypothetical protein